MADAGSTYIGQLSADGRWRWDGTDWRSVDTKPPAWASLRLRSRATWIALVAVVAVGLLTDQALRVGTFGLAASVTLGAGAVALMLIGRLQRLESRLLVIAAVVFAAWLTVRASPWLLLPDLAVSLALMCLAASFSARGSVFDLGAFELWSRALHGGLHLIAGAPFVARPVVEARGRISAVAPLVRGLLIAAPIAAVLAALLASADPIFASFFNLNIDPGQLVLDAFFVIVGALAMAGVMRVALAEPLEPAAPPPWRLGATETLVVLAVLDTLFAAFAIAQVVGVSGAGTQALRDSGVTYSDYARSGFFQLLWVSGITLVVLFVFSRITARSNLQSKRAVMAFALAAIALTLLIVMVAFRRLSLYEEAYGFTMLRLYSHIFAGWVAVVFVLLAVDLTGIRRRREWFIGITGATAAALLLALNVVNPEAMVVALNTNHAQTAHKIDAAYLNELSADATPALIDSTSRLQPDLRAQVSAVACAGPRSYSPSIQAFNWAEAEAAEARLTGC